MKYVLGKPMIGRNFVQYPACKDVNILAQFGLVRVIFRDIVEDSKFQVSIFDCNTNTLIYKQDGEPFYPSDVIINKPYRLIFRPYLGGYMIYDPYLSPSIKEKKVGVDKND